MIKGHPDTLHLTKMPYAASLGAETGARESGLILEYGRPWDLKWHEVGEKSRLNLDPPAAAATILEPPTCNHPR